MAGAPLSTIGEQIALALAAGAIATKKEGAATAIQDRYRALKRAVSRKSAAIRLGEIEADPSSEAHRGALAKDLEDHGAVKDRDVVTTARELLSLIKMDDTARAAVDTSIADVEAALLELSTVDIEEEPAVAPPAPTSRRLIPPDAPSKTELERLALPFWKRTDRFFMKALIVGAAYVILGVVAWLALRTPADDAIERCKSGDKDKCWQVVAAEDTVGQGRKVSTEPLQLLCERHHDACACAGLAYASASSTCNDLSRASELDPRWPCTCKRYEFWRFGQPRMSECGVPRCE